jgi:hypothetical protein
VRRLTRAAHHPRWNTAFLLVIASSRATPAHRQSLFTFTQACTVVTDSAFGRLVRCGSKNKTISSYPSHARTELSHVCFNVNHHLDSSLEHLLQRQPPPGHSPRLYQTTAIIRSQSHTGLQAQNCPKHFCEVLHILSLYGSFARWHGCVLK